MKAVYPEVFGVEVSFLCPQCGLQCSASSKVGVVHMMPPCTLFLGVAPDEFLRLARLAAEKRA